MGKCSPYNASEKDKLYIQCDLHFLSTSEKSLGKKYAQNSISGGGNTDSFKTSDFAVRACSQLDCTSDLTSRGLTSSTTEWKQQYNAAS